MTDHKTVATICTSTNTIEIISADEGRVLVIEAGGESVPFAILGDEGGNVFDVVSGSAWNGGGIPESPELLDPKVNAFAWTVEARRFANPTDARVARRLHVELELARQIWAADEGARMPEYVHEFMHRLLTAGQGLGVKVGSAAGINPGCRGLTVYVNGPLYRTQVIGIGLDQAGELQFTECGEQSAPRDLSRLCRLVAGRTLETWTVEFSAEHGFRAIQGETTDGILDDLVDAETAAALVVALEEACPKVNGTWEYSDPRIDVCPQHEKVARYMRRYLGSECTCCR